MDKILKLLEIAKKFGVKPSKVIGTQGNVVPYKKPSLVDISVDEFKLKESIDKGTLTMDKVQQEMEETVRLALSKNLNDVELHRALINAINIDRQFFPPMAEVVEAGSKQQVTGKGLEELIQKEGLTASPKTPLGQIQLRGKRLEQEAKDLSKEFDIGTLIKGAGRDQLSEIRLHNEGLVRAVTRQILSEDIKAGKIKGLTLDDLGTSREPIDYFRKIYGENALEQLDSLTADFNRLNTEREAASLARSKFKFEPNETRTKGSTSYEELEKTIKGSEQPKEAKILNITNEADKRKTVDELIDEYNTNFDRTKLTDKEGGTEIGYQEFQDIQKRNDEIAKTLEEKGISSAIEEEVKTEGIVIPFRKKFTKPEPEGKAQGGIIGYAMGGRIGFAEGTPMAGLVYVGSWEGPWTGPEFLGGPRKGQYYNNSKGLNILSSVPTANIMPGTGGFPGGPLSSPTTTSDSIPVTLTERYKKYLSAAGSGTSDELYKSYRANLDKKADGGRIGFAGGKSKAILDLIAKANKKLKGKKSMELVNPKTGEVTVPKEPIKTAEEPTGMTTMDQEPIAAVDQVNKEYLKSKTLQELQKEYKKVLARYEGAMGVLDPNTKDFEGFRKEVQRLSKIGDDIKAEYQTKKTVMEKTPLSDFEQIQANYRRASNAAEEIFPDYGDPKMAASQLAEVMADQKYEAYNKGFYDLPQKIQNELYNEAYNYVTSVNRLNKIPPVNKQLPPGTEFNISDDKTAEAFTNFARENDPEGFKKIQKIVDDINNKNALEEFDPTGRKPNAKGGPAGGLDYLMGF